MAIKTKNEKGDLTNDGIVKAMAFVADAADNGIDVRAVNNSYGGPIATPCLSYDAILHEQYVYGTMERKILLRMILLTLS